MLYQLSEETVLQWLESDAKVGRLLGPRLDSEGLALLGPQRLRHLAQSGRGAVRDAARRWVNRLG